MPGSLVFVPGEVSGDVENLGTSVVTAHHQMM
jgi:hypothetical protein